MTGSKTIGAVLLVAGIAVLLLSALADIVGLGGNPDIFGYGQIAGSVVGVMVAAIGALLYWLAGEQA